MIGNLCLATFPYYDSKTRCNKFKSRPILVIATADRNDWVTLPVSKVSRSENLDAEYDIQITNEIYPLMKLNYISYVRTHKQTITNQGEIVKTIVNVKTEYPDLYKLIISKVEEKYHKNIIEALK